MGMEKRIEKIGMIERIWKIRNRQSKLQKELNEAARAAFPIGGTVDFFKGNSRITAKILKFHGPYSCDPRFYIRSHTGKEYWIDLYWIMNRAG